MGEAPDAVPSTVPETVVDLHWIFSAPIEAVIDANIQAARKFVEFIERYGFVPNPDDGSQVLGELRMVTFSFDQPSGASGQPVKRLFRVPLLSLIPLPLLEVKSATFDFGVRLLVALHNEPVSKVKLLSGVAQDDKPPRDVKWRAQLARGTGDSPDTQPDLAPHLAANLQASVVVGQADIPAGIRNLMAVMGENAQLTGALLTVQPSRVDVPSDGQTTVALTMSGGNLSRRDTTIVAHYNETSLKVTTAGGEAWQSGHPLTVDGSGRLDISVARADGPPDQDRGADVVFHALIDGVSTLAQLACTVLPRIELRVEPAQIEVSREGRDVVLKTLTQAQAKARIAIVAKYDERLLSLSNASRAWPHGAVLFADGAGRLDVRVAGTGAPSAPAETADVVFQAGLAGFTAVAQLNCILVDRDR